MAGFDKKLLLAMKIFHPWLLFVAALAFPSAVAAQSGSAATYIDDRINQLQQSITMLTGQIEQLQYQNQQLQQQMEKMKTDYDFRLDQLEKGGHGGPRPSGPAAAGPVPSAPPHGPGSPPPASNASADQLYHDAFKLLEAGNYAGAERGFQSFVQRYPKHLLAGNAQYWLGESYYARRDYQKAMTAFAEGYTVEETPDGCHLTWVMAMKPSGLAGELGMRAGRPMMAWLFQRFLHNLRRYCDERYGA